MDEWYKARYKIRYIVTWGIMNTITYKLKIWKSKLIIKY